MTRLAQPGAVPLPCLLLGVLIGRDVAVGVNRRAGDVVAFGVIGARAAAQAEHNPGAAGVGGKLHALPSMRWDSVSVIGKEGHDLEGIRQKRLKSLESVQAGRCREPSGTRGPARLAGPT